MCDAEHFAHNPELHANGRFWCPDASCPKSHSSHDEFAGYTALRKLQMHIKGQQQKNSGHQGLPCKVVLLRRGFKLGHLKSSDPF